jgi:hypothetical protein
MTRFFSQRSMIMSGRTINVANATQLTRAIRTSVAGDTILLAPGNYGSVLVNARNPSGLVTIRSADPNAEAVFENLLVSRSSNHSFQDITVQHYLQPGERDVSQAVRVQSSRDISFVGMDVHGTLNNNPNDDGNGLWVVASSRVAVLDSSFRDLNNAVVFGTGSDIVLAGNRISMAREGINLSQIDGALVERNFITNILPNHARGDHGDAIQIHAGGAALSSNDLTIRSNVIKTGTSGSHGIYVNNEKGGRGFVHTNVVIDNNYYEGNARHGITVSFGENVTVTNNTVRDIGSGGLVPAINIGSVRNGLIDDNIAPLLLTMGTSNRNVTWSDNIDVWDRQFRTGVSDSSLFSKPVGSTDLDFSSLNVRGGTAAAAQGIGFAGISQIGDISASSGAMLAAYLPQFDAHTPHVVML